MIGGYETRFRFSLKSAYKNFKGIIPVLGTGSQARLKRDFFFYFCSERVRLLIFRKAYFFLSLNYVNLRYKLVFLQELDQLPRPLRLRLLRIPSYSLPRTALPCRLLVPVLWMGLISGLGHG